MQRFHIAALLALSLTVFSCFKDGNFEAGFSGDDSESRTLPGRSLTESNRRVLVLISAGFNSLSSYLSEDQADLGKGYLPEGKYYNSDAVLVLSRLPLSTGDYSPPQPVVLYHLYADRNGDVCRDTLKVWDSSVPLSRAETIHEALTLVQRKYPAKGFGIVFSSHASGWLPSGYYSDPTLFESSSGTDSWGVPARREVFPPIDPFPAVKSLGQDRTSSSADGEEMELRDFADAIPMHLDYLLLDACLTGCVEVAYAFKGKADIVGFSPTEVLANGFDYTRITRRLLQEQDPVAVCRDYFSFYDAQEGRNRSAAITAVAPDRMEPLADVCRELFEAYRPVINRLQGSDQVQGYFRFNRHYFYDLKDILVQAGISAEEQQRLQEALDACILYQAATEYFMTIPLKRVCGLSMYLPSMGSAYLDKFYKSQMAWNQATQLVK